MNIPPDAIHAIRQRLASQIEQAAQDLEQELTRDTLTRAAYEQGRADERQRLATSLLAWRDQLPPARTGATAQLGTALEAIVSTLREQP